MKIEQSCLFEGTAPRGGGFSLPGYWVWCGAPIRGEDGRYHLFASRWGRDKLFHPTWLTDSEIVRASADSPTGPYRFEEVVLPARGAEYWDGRMTHNPAIVRVGETYVLFYTGSTHPFEDVKPGEQLSGTDPRVIVARSNKRIGIATATSIHGPWTRRDAPVLPTAAGTFYSFLTSNAAPCVRPDGSVLLVFKSRRYDGNVHSPMMIGVAIAERVEGPYRVVGDRPLFSQETGEEVEDPYIWFSGGKYHLIAKDMTGNICGEYHGGAYATSPDGLNWTWARGVKAYSRRVRWDDGTEQMMGSFERPALLIEDGRPTHLFAAVADGPGGFWQAENTWSLPLLLKHTSPA